MSRSFIALLTFLLAIGFAASPLFVSGFNGFSPDQFPIPQDNPPDRRFGLGPLEAARGLYLARYAPAAQYLTVYRVFLAGGSRR